MFLCQEKRKERSKSLCLRIFIEMLKLLLMGDIYFQVCKTNSSKILNEGTPFNGIQAILNLTLDEDSRAQNKLIFLPDHC